MLPYYIAVSAVYGGLTWAANSILPLSSCIQEVTSGRSGGCGRRGSPSGNLRGALRRS
jgi:hypothetical protein